MSSLLTFQLRQQQQQKLTTEREDNSSSSGLPSPPNSFCGDESSSSSVQQPPPMIKVERRDSLGTVFNDMSIKDYSTSLPENYTIEHGSSSVPTTTTTMKRPSIAIATATAAATGGLTIRNSNNRRQSEASNVLSTSRRKSSSLVSSRLSESLNGQYRCNDCGKSYKHPNCLQKHRWEHSEEWEVTKNLSLTKHQQVQMLEAAAILIGMDRRTSGVSIKEVPKEEEEVQDIEDEEEESIIIDDEEQDDRLSIDSDSSSIFMEDL